MKKIKVVIILLFSFILVGCGSKTSITGDTFASKMTEMNYSIKDVLSNYDYAVSAYNAYKDEVSVFSLKEKRNMMLKGFLLMNIKIFLVKLEKTMIKSFLVERLGQA